MDYLLVIAFAVGLLLFLLSWLRVTFAGFGHHFLTGLFSLIPVLNVLVLPSLWHRVYGWVMVGTVGLLMAIASWFAGADSSLYRYTADAGFSLPSFAAGKSGVTTNTLTLQKKTSDLLAAPATPAVDPNQPAAPLPSGKELPKTALYRMSYQPVALTDLGSYQAHYIRITQQDRRSLEGKLLGLDENELTLERRTNGGIIEHKVKLADIATSEVMTKE